MNTRRFLIGLILSIPCGIVLGANQVSQSSINWFVLFGTALIVTVVVDLLDKIL